MAHEVAHLLMPSVAHAPSGIMRNDWTPSDYRRASLGQLRFTEEQAQLMREAIAASHGGSPPWMPAESAKGNVAFKSQKPSAIISTLGFWP